MKSRYFEPSRPRLFAHRGASAHFPENTLPAFEAAVAAGTPYLEMDVWATRDGHVVVHHDATLKRLCGVERPAVDCTLAELKALDAGYGFTPDSGRSHPFRGRGITVPTLGEVFAAFPGIRCNIEIKQESPPVEEAVLEVVRRHGKEEEVLLAAEKDAVMQRLRPACGEIPTSLSYSELFAFFQWVMGGCREEWHSPGVALQIPESWQGQTLVTPETIKAAHAAGLEIHVWTVNEAEDMKRLLELGVDGLMSDVPERLVAVAGGACLESR